MDSAQQSIKISVSNFDLQSAEEVRRHGELLPNTIKAIFCVPSNYSKTNSLLALIAHPNGLRFENIYVYSKSLNQPKYNFFEEIIKPIAEIKYHPFTKHESVISPDDALPNSIMIFDDIACKSKIA